MTCNRYSSFTSGIHESLNPAVGAVTGIAVGATDASAAATANVAAAGFADVAVVAVGFAVAVAAIAAGAVVAVAVIAVAVVAAVCDGVVDVIAATAVVAHTPTTLTTANSSRSLLVRCNDAVNVAMRFPARLVTAKNCWKRMLMEDISVVSSGTLIQGT